MGRKNIQESYKMFDNVDISGSQTSADTTVKTQDKAFVIIEWSGSSPVGAITVQARNYKYPVGPDSGWVTLDFGSAIAVSGNTGNHQLVFNEMPFTDIRLVYTSTSGTGTLSAYISSKVVGA